MKITMTANDERQRARLYAQKAKNCETFLYKKLDTFQKARQFPLRFYIQKTIHSQTADLASLGTYAGST